MLAACGLAAILLSVSTSGSESRSPSRFASGDLSGNVGDQAIYFWRGALMQPMTPDLARAGCRRTAAGMLIDHVDPRSSVAAVGLKKGDIITALDGVRVLGPRNFVIALVDEPPHRSLDLTVWRDGQRRRIVMPLRTPSPGRASQ